MDNSYQTLEIYIVVKSYPQVDLTVKGEAVCVAGVKAEPPHEWVRLYPLDFRGLETEQQFKKYQKIRLQVHKARQDSRPESYTPVLDSIETLDQLDTDDQTWRRRMQLLEPIRMQSMCELLQRQAADGTSLGFFRPARILDLRIEHRDPKKIEGKQALLDQQSFFDERTNKLEPLPLKASYRYKCEDSRCTGHNQSLIDWEFGALYRKLTSQALTDDEVVGKLRQRFFDEVCGSRRDTSFFAGNMIKHPKSFLILGLVWPKKRHPSLF